MNDSARSGTGAGRPSGPDVFLTVDAEPDCPPYLSTWRGMEEGAPLLLDLFAREDVPATLFTTGEAALRFPDFVADAVRRGHEIGCHGMSHRPFPQLTRQEAEDEIASSAAVLRREAPVVAFRAPYLRFPGRYLPLLERHGFRLDSSRGRYKPAHWRPARRSPVRQVPASVTSSWLRLPGRLRDPMLRRLRSPVVLFVHPWEFVDMRAARIPWDCRVGTGARAVEALTEVVGLFRSMDAHFMRMSALLDGRPGAQGEPEATRTS